MAHPKPSCKHHIYVMIDSSGYVKVGRTDSIRERKAALEKQWGCDISVRYSVGFDKASDCALVEKFLHAYMRKWESDKHHRSHEWYLPEAVDHMPAHFDTVEAFNFLLRSGDRAFLRRVGSRWNPKRRRTEPYLAIPYGRSPVRNTTPCAVGPVQGQSLSDQTIRRLEAIRLKREQRALSMPGLW